jgi:hypothetical protein
MNDDRKTRAAIMRVEPTPPTIVALSRRSFRRSTLSPVSAGAALWRRRNPMPLFFRRTGPHNFDGPTGGNARQPR